MRRIITMGAIFGLGLWAGCDEGIQTVGPRGGVVSSPDGRLTLEIPAGALDREIDIVIDQVDEAPEGAVGPTYEVLPRGTGFLRPVEVTYDLTGDEMTLSDPAAAMLVVEKAEGWNQLADHEVDPELGMVFASATFLSAFGIVEIDRS